LIQSFLKLADAYLRADCPEEARVVARQTLDIAIALKLHRGQCHFVLARVLAVLARNDPQQLKPAAQQLYRAIRANKYIYTRGYKRDPLFDPVRSQLDLELEEEAIHHEQLLLKPGLARDGSL